MSTSSDAIVQLIAVVKSIPATFWGVIFGSFFSIISVYLTNKANAQRLYAQFKSERQNRAIDNEYNIRKEIYLSATEALQVGLQALGNMSDMDKNVSDILLQYNDRMPAIAKLYAIGREETSRTIASFSSQLAISIASTTMKRVPIAWIIADINSLDNARSEATNSLNSLGNILGQMHLSGNVDESRKNAILQQIDAAQRQCATLNNSRKNYVQNRLNAQIELGRFCIEELRKLQPLLMPALQRAREDLGISNYSKDFDKFWLELTERAHAYSREGIENIAKMASDRVATQI